MLPLIGWVLAHEARPWRSRLRLLAGIAALILSCVAARELLGPLGAEYPVLAGHAPGWAIVLLLALHGAQGHFPKVFAAGMFCGTLYVAAENGLLCGPQAREWIGVGLFATGMVLAGALAEAVARPAYHTAIITACYQRDRLKAPACLQAEG